MQDLDARLQMIEIAESYERMAQRARERQERGENLLFPRLKLREPEGQASIA